MMEHYALTCGRQTLASHFGVSVGAEEASVRAITHTAQLLPVIHNQNPKAVSLLRWGLIPSWAQPTQQYNLINARADTLLKKQAYQKPFKQRRCLVPATGFYLTHKTNYGDISHHYVLKSQPIMAFAGLWDRWRASPEVEVDSFTIIVCPANDMIRPVDELMPVILRPADYATWLKPGIDTEELLKLLAPLPATEMEDRIETPQQVAAQFGVNL
jgi:putative SOS response-associated peptidase YedK